LKIIEANNLILIDESMSPGELSGSSDLCYVSDVLIMIGSSQLSVTVLRSNTTILSVAMEETSPDDGSLQESDISDAPNIEPAVKRPIYRRQTAFMADDTKTDDHFDEAMELFGITLDYDSDFSLNTYRERTYPMSNPHSPQGSLSDEYGFFTPYDSDFSVDYDRFERPARRPSVSSSSEETYEAQEGVDYELNDKFDSLPLPEVHSRIKSRLNTAAKIKAECMAITQAEIDLQEKLFEDKLERVRALWKESKDHYVPQSGSHDSIEHWLSKLDVLSSKMEDYSKILSSSEVDGVIKHIERLVLLFIELRETRSYAGMMACLLGYLQGLTQKSLFNTIREYLADALAMEAQSGSEDEERPEWLLVFRSITSNWKNATRLPAWGYFQRILSLSVSAGLCKAADVNFRIGDMKLFTVKIQDKQASAFDLMDAILATADYFVEAGYEAFKTRSARPFFFDNQTARILDDAYISISASMKALSTGDLISTKYTTEHELAHVIDNTLSGYMILRHQAKGSQEKRSLELRCMKLEEWKLEFIQTTVAGGLREAPYSIYLVGAPGIGKSMMTQVLLEVVMQANGIEYTQKQVATVNPGDKFASTVKNDTIAIILDDFGNFVLEFENENPLKYIIEICNNVVSYVPKAEAQDKGKIAYRPKVVITTSNLMNLLFDKLSNAPGSAKRRGIRMVPQLKPEYAEHDRFSEDKYRELNGGKLPAVPDAYTVDIQEWGVKDWEYFKFESGNTKELTYAQALEFHVIKSRDHFKKQKDYVQNHGAIRDQIQICDHGRLATDCRTCKKLLEEQALEEEECFTSEKFEAACAQALDVEFEPHFGVEYLSGMVWNWIIGRLIGYLRPYRQSFSEYLANSSNAQLQWLNTRMSYFSLFGYYDYLPDWIVRTPLFERYLLFVNGYSLVLQYWQLAMTFFASFFLFLLGPSAGGIINACVVWPYLFQCATMTHRSVIDEFYQRRGALPEEFTARRDQFLKYALTGVFLLSGLAVAYKMYQSVKMMEPQGNIAPTSIEDIKARDAEQSDWARTTVNELPVSDKSKCIDHATLLAKVRKNQVYVNYEVDGKKLFVNGFFTKSNELLIPYHILTDEPKTFTIYRRGEQVRGARFSEILSASMASVHPTKDIALVQCCNTAPFADVTEYFAIQDLDRTPFTMSFQQKDGEHRAGHGVTISRNVNNRIRRFKGYEYILTDMKTFCGLCGAVMISQSRAPQILGFHVGGKTDTGHGCAASLTQSEVQELSASFYAKHISALEHISEGTVFTEHYGIEWYEGPQIHEKSPLNFIPVESNIQYFGSCSGRTSYYTDVIQTPISSLVDEVCGTTQQYKGPHFHRWKSWYESLTYSCDPAIGCDTDLLDRAVGDYKRQIWGVLDVKGIREEVRKLTEIETVSGIDGRHFVDAMPPNTSCGAPLGGPKRGKLIELAPTPEHKCPRTFCSGIWEEVRRMRAAHRSGQRYYPLFKACLKDEPTPVEKEKVRVFQAAPLSLQITIRELFLPIARVMSLFPLKSECAVGINSQGKEWDVMQAHIKKFGVDRVVAGDYAKYDLRMSAKFTSAAFKIMIDFAEECGYSQEDLAAMRAVATEVVYPMTVFNGDVIMLQGSNPSGQNLTVYVNSIVNSLLNRVGFFMIYPEFEGNFSDAVALVTYGDDFKSTASSDYPDFNHINLAEKLASIDMKITMPDKNAEPTPFMHDEECDFLKRRNRYHEVGYYLGALDEESIIKPLKAVLRPKHVSIEEQCAKNIDDALREWFLHGKDVYEKRRQQMKIIAERGEIGHMCTLLEDDFEARMRVWHNKYEPSTEDEATTLDVEETVFEPQSGVQHDLCEWDNCGIIMPYECEYVNCTPSPIEVFVANCWLKIYSTPFVLYFFFLIMSGRTRWRWSRLTFVHQVILGSVFLLEGLGPWIEMVRFHLLLVFIGWFWVQWYRLITS
jgi:hypothetical protein